MLDLIRTIPTRVGRTLPFKGLMLHFPPLVGPSLN